MENNFNKKIKQQHYSGIRNGQKIQKPVKMGDKNKGSQIQK